MMGNYKKNKVAWLTYFNSLKVQELTDYLDTVNAQMQLFAAEYDNRVQEQAKSIEDDHERAEFLDSVSESHWRHTESFPRILLNSFHISAYAVLESEMLSLANRVGESQKQLFHVTDFGGRDYLGNASTYILRVTGTSTDKCASWTTLKDGRRFRNVIVHCDGVLSREHDITLAKKYRVLDASSLDGSPPLRSTLRLSLTRDYCASYLAAIQEFYADLLRRIGSHL